MVVGSEDERSENEPGKRRGDGDTSRRGGLNNTVAGRFGGCGKFHKLKLMRDLSCRRQ